MKSKKVIKDLEAIMQAELINFPFPSISADKISIKDYHIIEIKTGFRVLDKRKRVIADTYFKKSAVAIAKSLTQGRNNTKRILELDALASKHYADVQIFQHTIKTSKTDFMRESRKARLSKTARWAAYYTKQIENFIYK